MAEESSGGGNPIGEMFAAFPIAFTIVTFIFIYLVWVATGGVERGIERHAQERDSIFIEVNSLPGQPGETFFGQVKP